MSDAQWVEERGQAGYFRVAKRADGVWWLRDPAGRPFFYRGVCGINRAGKAGGRLAKPGPYAEVVDSRYGYAQEGPSRFVEATRQRLRDWGFNATGAWTTVEFFDCGLPYTEFLGFSKLTPVLHDEWLRLPDVFSTTWEVEIDRQARELCWPRRHDPRLVGYFTDNELPWSIPEGTDRDDNPELGRRPAKPGLLQTCLVAAPTTATHGVAWQLVRERHGDSLARVGEAYGVNLESPEAMAEWTRAGGILWTGPFLRDQVEFAKIFARRYFQQTATAIRRYDPHHLILGCRFGGLPGNAILAECTADVMDVLSFNNYRATFGERIDAYHQATGLPVLNGEFAFASGYFTADLAQEAKSASDAMVAEHARELGRRALRQAFSHPALVGYTWYRWVQNSFRGPIGYGLVDFADVPNPWSVDLLREVHAEADALHDRAAYPTAGTAWPTWSWHEVLTESGALATAGTS